MTGVAEGDNLLRVLAVIVRSTKEGKVKWRTTDKENAFLFSGSGSSVLVQSWLDAARDQNVGVKILNASGQEVASLKSTWPDNPEVDWSDPDSKRYLPGPNNALLEDLYESARRAALDIDGVLDSLLKDVLPENGD